VPSLPAPPCSAPGCPALATYRGKCKQHAPDAQRQSAASRGYGTNWRALRLLVLHEEPVCRECLVSNALVDPDSSAALGKLVTVWSLLPSWIASTVASMRSRGVEPAARRPRESVQVDHIQPLKEGGGNGRANLQGLCLACHSGKTAIVSSGWGAGMGEGGSKSLNRNFLDRTRAAYENAQVLRRG
jgi:5-methylcytosine-specific restriction endonuclease McrA